MKKIIVIGNNFFNRNTSDQDINIKADDLGRRRTKQSNQN